MSSGQQVDRNGSEPLSNKGFRVGVGSSTGGDSLKERDICSGFSTLELNSVFQRNAIVYDVHTTLLQAYDGLSSLG